MSGTMDLDVLKDIPGYKAILKSVIKTQIQMLVEQLAQHTEEESIILTASVNDGTLSHLGSGTGKGFLEGRDEIKSQFLGYCLKSHHRKKAQEPPAAPSRPSPYPRGGPPQPSPRASISHPVPAKRPRVHPVSMSRVAPGHEDETPPGISRNISSPSQRISTPGGRGVLDDVAIGKLEPGGDDANSFNGTSSISFPSSLQMSHTQTSGESYVDSQHNTEQSKGNVASGDNDSNSGSASNVKIEPITEGEMELEITGVEMGNVSHTPGGEWGANMSADQIGYGASEGDDSIGQDGGDQSGYMFIQTSEGRLLNRIPEDSLQQGQTAMISGRNAEQQTGYRKHICQFCQKGFKFRSDLVRHENSHRGYKPFSCTKCNASFGRKDYVRRHMIMRHSETDHLWTIINTNPK